MQRLLALELCLCATFCSVLCLTPSPTPAQPGVVVVEMHPPFDPGGRFPVGWAVLNILKGEVTLMAILPANTSVPDSSRHFVFEGWVADLAPPHRCRIPDSTDDVEEGTGEIELDDLAIVGEVIPEATDDPEFQICGSRRSSETGFRGFPGLINKTFQHTYFPASQGLLRRIGLPLGDWQFYVTHHKTNMGLRWADVVGVTVEPPGTGAPRHDYDPRPNPVVILAGRIPALPLPEVEGDDEGAGFPVREAITPRRPPKRPGLIR